MALECGFFNSVNGDRQYPARLFNSYFKGIIGEGVFMSQNSSALQVVSNNNMTVTVKPGKYFSKTGEWLEIDANIDFEVPTPDVTLPRREAVVVTIWQDEARRTGDIVYRAGTPASNPQNPPSDTTATSEFPLAYINVPAGATRITQANIIDARTKVACLIDSVDTSTLYAQYQDALETFLEETASRIENLLDITEEDFARWFEEFSAEKEENFNNWLEGLGDQVEQRVGEGLFGFVIEDKHLILYYSKEEQADKFSLENGILYYITDD